MASLLVPTKGSQVPPTSAYAAWMTVCVLWGTTYLAIRIALEGFPPGLLGGIRFTIAGAALAAFVKLRGDHLPAAPEWPRQALIGVLMLGIGNGFVVVAEEWLPSGVAAVGVASAPFWMSAIGALAGLERFTLRTLAGFCVGFTGIVVLIWPDLFQDGTSGGHFVMGVVLLQVACLGWSIGSWLSMRFTPQGSVLASVAVQQLSGGLVTLVVGTVAGEWNAMTLSARAISAEAYLILFGSLGAYSAYVYALQHLPLATVSLYAYVNPIIAVILGVVLANEPFSPRIVVAAALVLGGIAAVRIDARNRARPRRAVAA
jgi:drug/metabolite transporter (DMT)-like permease